MRHMASPATAWHVEASIHFVESDFVVKPFGDERRPCEYGFSGSVVSRPDECEDGSHTLVLFERKLCTTQS